MTLEPKPQCAVRGLIRPGAMCSKVIVGAKLCGAQPGTCQHQRPPADVSAGVDVPLAPSTYAPSREVVQQALELVDRIRDSHASWGGWSGIPQTCERITSMLRYGSADDVGGTLNEQQENKRG